MQPIEKKKVRGSSRLLRILPLPLLAAAIAAVLVLNARVSTETAAPAASATPAGLSYGELITHTADEVARVQITLPGEEPWALVRTDSGMVMEGEPDWPLDESLTEDVLDAAAVISYNMILSDDPAEYSGKLQDFGLQEPHCVAEITWTDGTGVTVRVGDKSQDTDESFYYMTVDGYAGLYALDTGTAEALCTGKQLMRAVTQPEIYKALIDSIRFEKQDGTLAWKLDGSITDADAEDRWLLTEPVTYPAEGETISNLRANLANLRLGAYIGEATPENLELYGFTTPRLVLTVHMAAGTLGTVSDAGVYDTKDYEASTFTLTLGGEKSDVVDYVMTGGSIYTTSHYLLQVFLDMTAASTVTRYPVRVTLSNLKTLTIEKDGVTQVWQVTRDEELDEETGEIITDDDGNTVYDYSVTLNGEAYDWDAFEPAYYTLVACKVSGTLPEGWTATEPVHTRFTFTTRTGTTHTIELTRFDALHDAVICDGYSMFYLIHGGLSLGL